MPDIQNNVEALLGKLGNALEELTTLRIQTAVTGMDVDKQANGKWNLQPVPGDPTDGITTTIRLDQGDIQNAMTAGALQNAKLMEIHNQQVALSRQIIADNIKALVDLAKSLVD